MSHEAHDLDPSPRVRSLIVCSYVLAAAVVFAVWASGTDNYTGINLYPDRSLAGIVHGSASRPFVLRVLVPLCVRAVEAVLPESVEAELSELLFAGAGPAWRGDLYLHGIAQGHVVDYVLVMLASFASLLGFMFTERALLRELFVAPAWFALLGPLAAVAILPGFFKNGTHLLYDFPALLSAALLCLMLARRQLVGFYVLLALAMLNKETAALFVLLFALDARRWLPKRRLYVHLACQVGLCVALRGVVLLAFADSPGALVEHHLLGNLRVWMVPPHWFACAAFMATLAAVFRRFTQRPALLRAGVWLFVPFFGLHLFFGYPGEIRAFYEVVPVYFALGYASWAEWMDTPIATREAPT